MPELPEVQTVRAGLEKLVLGTKITKVEIFYPKIIIGDTTEFCEKLVGQVIEKIDRRGKYLLFRFSNNLTMISHLRMEGKYFVLPSKQEPKKHTHVVFELDNGQKLCYNDVRKFGRMQLVITGQEESTTSLCKLGPEPVLPDFKVKDFYQALQGKKKVIKTALLDQSLVAGLGNIYVDEVLWMSKIHPQTLCNKITFAQAKVLHANIIEELALAVQAGGTTIRSYTDAFEHSGMFQFNLHVYGKKGQPCERCQTKIEKIVVGQRGTHFCPKCQKVSR
ncbi:DNA-formamidopyrimidine glycosylase [Ligilactobacillus sp. Marseille-Q7487]|uniref:DNA-formamidopyrimidine glycosylase n=1 Tax=Ligilactobacillus sp. Marseille-Q7487 TaxID=3022128 RepID=UPI0024A7A5F8|nr:DNA-formamidopyrimidine glycosylase [Ligilactobacillus sp. Marseille-Q7487]